MCFFETNKANSSLGRCKTAATQNTTAAQVPIEKGRFFLSPCSLLQRFVLFGKEELTRETFCKLLLQLGGSVEGFPRLLLRYPLVNFSGEEGDAQEQSLTRATSKRFTPLNLSPKLVPSMALLPASYRVTLPASCEPLRYRCWGWNPRPSASTMLLSYGPLHTRSYFRPRIFQEFSVLAAHKWPTRFKFRLLSFTSLSTLELYSGT